MSDRAGTQSIDRAVDILRIVAARSGRGIRLVEVTQQSGLTKPTAHRVLRGLVRQGLVEFEQDVGLYHLGPEAFVIGILAEERYGIHQAALPSLTRLAQESGDTSFLSVRRNWHAVCLRREEGPFPIRTHALQVGNRHPLGVGAGSLAILAALSNSEVEEAIAANAEQLKAQYPGFTAQLLRSDVAQARKQGFAFNPGRLVPGSCGVGVVVRNQRGQIEGALSIAAIEGRLGEARRKKLAALLEAEATQLGQLLTLPSGATNLTAATPHQSSTTRR